MGGRTQSSCTLHSVLAEFKISKSFKLRTPTATCIYQHHSQRRIRDTMDANILNDLPAVPHLSPSLTASVNSVNSSSLPSPKSGIFVHRPQPPDAKFPADDSPFPQPSARRMSSRMDSDIHPPHFSDPHTSASYNSTSWTDSIWACTTAAQKKMTKRFHPYDPRGVASPLELCFAARSLGFSSHIGLTMKDVLHVRHDG